MLVTHEIEKVLSHAHTLILMDAGTIVATGEPDEVVPMLESHGVRRPRCPYGYLDVAHMTWLT
ncbi:MAG: hypothetical protein PHS18_04290, partial [Sphaerochaetaceae bacterium]|nr:hypothetical protein [Sphaerochaetaceae bacterium]